MQRASFLRRTLPHRPRSPRRRDGSNQAQGQPSLLTRQLAAPPGRKPASSQPACWRVCHTLQSSLAAGNVHRVALGTASLARLHHRLTPHGDTLALQARGGSSVPSPWVWRFSPSLQHPPEKQSGRLCWFCRMFCPWGTQLIKLCLLFSHPHHASSPCYPLTALVTHSASKPLMEKLPLAAPHLTPPSLVRPGLLRQSQPVSHSWLVYFKSLSNYHHSY